MTSQIKVFRVLTLVQYFNLASYFHYQLISMFIEYKVKINWWMPVVRTYVEVP